jgi:death-on-curing protein
MTEERKSSIQYLTKEDIELIHSILSEKFESEGEPIPSFRLADTKKIEVLVNAPQRSFFGAEAYPTIFHKAAILFYSVNKGQIFPNGNKRMSTVCLLVFLALNGKSLDVEPDELTKKALELAKTESGKFQEVKEELVQWLKSHSKDLEIDDFSEST